MKSGEMLVPGAGWMHRFLRSNATLPGLLAALQVLVEEVAEVCADG